MQNMPENFLYQLLLADGTTLNNCSCGLYENTVTCFIKDIPFAEAFMYFVDPNNFSTIIFDIVYSMGYTDRFEYSGIEKVTSVIQKVGQVDVSLEGHNIQVRKSRIYNQETEVINE